MPQFQALLNKLVSVLLPGSEGVLLKLKPGGGTPIHYLYGYVPPNGVGILKLLV